MKRVSLFTTAFALALTLGLVPAAAQEKFTMGYGAGT